MYIPKKEKQILICIALIYILITILCIFFVNTHDDYMMYYGKNIDGSVKYASEIGNGRYIGNFLGNFLSQRKVLNTLIKGLVITGIIVLCSGISGEITFTKLVVCTFLMLGTGKQIFAEAYVWSHGFYNYAMPIVFLLLSIYLIQKYSSAVPLGMYFLTSLIGFAQMLFSENTTVIALIIAAFSLWICYKKGSRKLCVVYLIAAILGVIICFEGPNISGTAHNIDWYREVQGGGITGIIWGAFYNAVKIGEVFSKCLFLWIISIFVFSTERGIGTARKIVRVVMMIVLITVNYLLTIDAAHISEYEIKDYIKIAAMLLAAAYYIYLLFRYLKCFDLHKKLMIIAAITIAVLSAGELLFVSPIGPRCVLITYTFITIAISSMLQLEFLPEKKLNIFCAVIACAAIAFYGIRLFEFAEIYKIDNLRISFIEEQLRESNNEIYVIALPDKHELLYEPNNCEGFEYTFNTGTPEDMHFTLISLEQYENYISQN